MRSLYKSGADREAVARWCRRRLDAWEVPHHRATVRADGVEVHLVRIGTGPAEVVFVPGTNFNAATSLPVAQALSRRWTTIVVDLPGQPGLSSGARPRAAHRGWYAERLAGVLDAVGADRIVAVGHSLGGSVLLGCDSDRIAGRVLLAPAGVTKLKVRPRTMARSLRWLLASTPERAESMLEDFVAEGHRPPEPIVQWLHLVATHCRSSLAPPPLPEAVLRPRLGSPMIVAAGAADCFLPPDRLGPAVRARLGVDLHVIDGAGHLAADERPEAVADLVDRVRARLDG